MANDQDDRKNQPQKGQPGKQNPPSRQQPTPEKSDDTDEGKDPGMDSGNE